MYVLDKIWETHKIDEINNYDVLYIDYLILHDLTSLRAFQNILKNNRTVFSPNKVFVIPDHIPPFTTNPISIKLKNIIFQLSNELKLNYIDYSHKAYGISHLVLNDLGIAEKDSIIAGGDSHIISAGAYGLLSFALGSSDIERILLTQSLPVKKPDYFAVNIIGKKNKFVTEFDIMLEINKFLSKKPVKAKVVIFTGDYVNNLTYDDKATLCGLSAESGVFSSFILNKNNKFDILRENITVYNFNISNINPKITFTTSPKISINIDETIPTYNDLLPITKREYLKGLDYMGLKIGESLIGKKIQKVFIGSCTGAKYDDIAKAEIIIRGKKINPNIKAYLSVGSNSIYDKAYKNGIIESFKQAGFQILHPGCSMCTSLGNINITQKEYIVSTISRNYEGRQGYGVRTLLASPVSAAWFSLEGRIIKYY